MSVGGTAVGIHPVIPDFLWVFQDAGVLQNARGLRAIFEERAAVFLHGNGRAEGVLHHGDGRKAHQTVEGQSGNVEDLIAAEHDVLKTLKDVHGMEPPLTLAEKEKEPQHIVVPNFNRHNIFYCEDFIALFFR